MKFLRNLNSVEYFSRGSIAAIGNFDGMHLGHQALLQTIKKQAKDANLPTVLIIFEPQPSEYFQAENAAARLSSLRDKIEYLRGFDLDYLLVLKFDKILSKIPAKQFAEQILFSKLRVKQLIIGKDFRFGCGREGNVDLLASLATKNACNIQVMEDFLVNEKRVSSTQIRSLLASGMLQEAAQYLGRNYSISGRVIRGDGRGRLWGIPTANLKLQRKKLALTGVFSVLVKTEGASPLPAVANLGTRPTVDGSKVVLEVHILDFDSSLYGKIIQVSFLEKLRDEQKFASVDELIKQIRLDILMAREYFNKQDQYIT